MADDGGGRPASVYSYTEEKGKQLVARLEAKVLKGKSGPWVPAT